MRYLLLIFFIIFTGCSVKVYEPQKTETKKLKTENYYKTLSEYTKNTLTFSTLKLKYVPKKDILDDGIKVEKVYYDKKGNYLGKFIKVNNDLAVNGNKLYVISQKTEYKLPFLIFGATKKENNVAVVFENGKYGLYDLKDKKMKFIFEGDSVLSVRYLHAEPLFYKDLILYPMLSGSVAVVELDNGNYIRSLNISQNQFNDNVIFLKIVNNQLFMATPSKLVLFNPSFLIDYKADIKHIIDNNGFIYIFTADGSIIKLDSNLKEIKKIKLPFASFFAPSVCKGNIWSVERGGYLIKITPDLNVIVYKGNDFDTSSDAQLKLEGCKIYNNDKVFMIE
ncbi:hypothetical protein [Nautilia lithotrophica]